jgi:ABC-type antimicrobial peptide transport system permease subunit
MRVPAGASTTNADASRRLHALLPQADMRIASVGARLEGEARLPRMLATLTGLIGCVAIFLSVIGLYGLAASLAGQRAREFAIRAALGAGARDLLRLMVWDSVRPVVLGLAAGVLTALAAGRLLAATMFYGVSPQDPVAHAAAAAILLIAGIVAVLAPARTASTVDSAALLRR